MNKVPIFFSSDAHSFQGIYSIGNGTSQNIAQERLDMTGKIKVNRQF